MELAAIAALLVIAGIVYWRSRSDNGNGGEFPPVLYFERSSVPDYRTECLERIRSEVYPLMETLRAKGYNRRAIACVLIWETGWLSDPKARQRIEEYHNVLGIDTRSGARHFASYEDCFNFFEGLMHNDNFDYPRLAYPVRGLGIEFLEALHASGYNSNETWINGVKSLYHGGASTLPE